MKKFITPVCMLSLLAGCADQEEAAVAQPAPVTAETRIEAAALDIDAARLVAADAETANWITHGRTYSEQRFSPLDQIRHENVQRLGLAWYFDLETNRGMEATPLVVDGVMFTTGSWSVVYAHDAASGELLWKHDPRVPREWAVHLCCDVVNRGVALWQGRVFVGTLDGRLIALDASTGEQVWSVQTTDRERPYSITGAPRVVKGRVIIGNGGSEFGVRGYVSAYDVDNGAMLWRFYTVPGDPAEPFESRVLETAAETWKGGEWWKIGGGGTVWDSMAYDPQLDLLYVGVGNGSPWNRHVRSPGGGDNLFLSSIVALRPETGEYVWHYQTTPGDSWDYTATQHMILADLDLGEGIRQVIMQAPKNGFFYVIDRATGDLISAENYVPVSWASHVDPETGRPVLTATADYSETPQLTFPSPFGGHNWQPMAYSPSTGLIYIPAQEIPWVHGQDEGFTYAPGFWNTATDITLNLAPDDPDARRALAMMIKGQLTAWDPVQQREVWRVQHAGPWNGGVLATAGELVFQGNASGEFAAYRAHDGEVLWRFPAQTGVMAAPVTYTVDGDQYVTVVAGWGGTYALGGGEIAAAAGVRNVSRVLTFRLDGQAELPPLPVVERTPQPPPLTADAGTVRQGERRFNERCAVCHGLEAVGGGVLPDLRYMDTETHKAFYAIVLGGLHRERGMVSFAPVLDAEDVTAIHAYVIERSHALLDSD